LVAEMLSPEVSRTCSCTRRRGDRGDRRHERYESAPVRGGASWSSASTSRPRRAHALATRPLGLGRTLGGARSVSCGRDHLADAFSRAEAAGLRAAGGMDVTRPGPLRSQPAFYDPARHSHGHRKRADGERTFAAARSSSGARGEEPEPEQQAESARTVKASKCQLLPLADPHHSLASTVAVRAAEDLSTAKNATGDTGDFADSAADEEFCRLLEQALQEARELGEDADLRVDLGLKVVSGESAKSGMDPPGDENATWVGPKTAQDVHASAASAPRDSQAPAMCGGLQLATGRASWAGGCVPEARPAGAFAELSGGLPAAPCMPGAVDGLDWNCRAPGHTSGRPADESQQPAPFVQRRISEGSGGPSDTECAASLGLPTPCRVRPTVRHRDFAQAMADRRLHIGD